MAKVAGVPLSWLRDETLSGRIPKLRAGRRILFSPAAVLKVLSERAAKMEQPTAEAANHAG